MLMISVLIFKMSTLANRKYKKKLSFKRISLLNESSLIYAINLMYDKKFLHI